MRAGVAQPRHRPVSPPSRGSEAAPLLWNSSPASAPAPRTVQASRSHSPTAAVEADVAALHARIDRLERASSPVPADRPLRASALESSRGAHVAAAAASAQAGPAIATYRLGATPVSAMQPQPHSGRPAYPSSAVLLTSSSFAPGPSQSMQYQPSAAAAAVSNGSVTSPRRASIATSVMGTSVGDLHTAASELWSQLGLRQDALAAAMMERIDARFHNHSETLAAELTRSLSGTMQQVLPPPISAAVQDVITRQMESVLPSLIAHHVQQEVQRAVAGAMSPYLAASEQHAKATEEAVATHLSGAQASLAAHTDATAAALDRHMADSREALAAAISSQQQALAAQMAATNTAAATHTSALDRILAAIERQEASAAAQADQIRRLNEAVSGLAAGQEATQQRIAAVQSEAAMRHAELQQAMTSASSAVERVGSGLSGVVSSGLSQLDAGLAALQRAQADGTELIKQHLVSVHEAIKHEVHVATALSAKELSDTIGIQSKEVRAALDSSRSGIEGTLAQVQAQLHAQLRDASASAASSLQASMQQAVEQVRSEVRAAAVSGEAADAAVVAAVSTVSAELQQRLDHTDACVREMSHSVSASIAAAVAAIQPALPVPAPVPVADDDTAGASAMDTAAAQRTEAVLSVLSELRTDIVHVQDTVLQTAQRMEEVAAQSNAVAASAAREAEAAAARAADASERAAAAGAAASAAASQAADVSAAAQQAAAQVAKALAASTATAPTPATLPAADPALQEQLRGMQEQLLGVIDAVTRLSSAVDRETEESRKRAAALASNAAAAEGTAAVTRQQVVEQLAALAAQFDGLHDSINGLHAAMNSGSTDTQRALAAVVEALDTLQHGVASSGAELAHHVAGLQDTIQSQTDANSADLTTLASVGAVTAEKVGALHKHVQELLHVETAHAASHAEHALLSAGARARQTASVTALAELLSDVSLRLRLLDTSTIAMDAKLGLATSFVQSQGRQRSLLAGSAATAAADGTTAGPAPPPLPAATTESSSTALHDGQLHMGELQSTGESDPFLASLPEVPPRLREVYEAAQARAAETGEVDSARFKESIGAKTDSSGAVMTTTTTSTFAEASSAGAMVAVVSAVPPPPPPPPVPAPAPPPAPPAPAAPLHVHVHVPPSHMIGSGVTHSMVVPMSEADGAAETQVAPATRAPSSATSASTSAFKRVPARPETTTAQQRTQATAAASSSSGSASRVAEELPATVHLQRVLAKTAAGAGRAGGGGGGGSRSPSLSQAASPTTVDISGDRLAASGMMDYEQRDGEDSYSAADGEVNDTSHTAGSGGRGGNTSPAAAALQQRRIRTPVALRAAAASSSPAAQKLLSSPYAVPLAGSSGSGSGGGTYRFPASAAAAATSGSSQPAAKPRNVGRVSPVSRAVPPARSFVDAATGVASVAYASDARSQGRRSPGPQSQSLLHSPTGSSSSASAAARSGAFYAGPWPPRKGFPTVDAASGGAGPVAARTSPPRAGRPAAAAAPARSRSPTGVVALPAPGTTPGRGSYSSAQHHHRSLSTATHRGADARGSNSSSSGAVAMPGAATALLVTQAANGAGIDIRVIDTASGTVIGR